MKNALKQIGLLLTILSMLSCVCTIFSPCRDCDYYYYTDETNNATNLQAHYIVNEESCIAVLDDSEELFSSSCFLNLQQYPFDSVYAIGGKDLIDFPNELALNPLRDTTTFVFVKPNRIDTLAFLYERNQDFYSEACGYTMIYQNITISHHTFDSIYVISALPWKMAIVVDEQ